MYSRKLDVNSNKKYFDYLLFSFHNRKYCHLKLIKNMLISILNKSKYTKSLIHIYLFKSKSY